MVRPKSTAASFCSCPEKLASGEMNEIGSSHQFQVRFNDHKKEMGMFKLYARAGAGSAAVEAMLALCNAKHEIVDVPKSNGKSPEWFLAINPRGEVPTLQMPDDTVMTESAAIVMHLADCFPESGLAPPVGTPARATYMRAIIYMAANTYGSDLLMYYPDRYSTDPADAPRIKAKAIEHLNRDFNVFADMLGAGPFVLGQKMSAADVYAAMLITWSDDFAALTKRLPKLRALYDAVSATPVVRRVWERNEMP
jgi:glutathione S-transferase